MKRAGWIGIIAIAIGVLMVWAGYQNVSLLAALKAVLSGEPLPKAAEGAKATTGSSGGSGFQYNDKGEIDSSPKAGAGDGAGGGGGGGW